MWTWIWSTWIRPISSNECTPAEPPTEGSVWYIIQGNWWWKKWHIFPWCPWWNWEDIPHIIAFGHCSCEIGHCGSSCFFWHSGHIVRRMPYCSLKLRLILQHYEQATFNISKQSTMAKILKESKIIIWDECTMAHKRAFEALDRTLKDLRNDSRCFGGAMILLSGDFRQTLLVIPRSTAADDINACLKSSNLWCYVKRLQLTTNMRVALLNHLFAEDLSKQLLTIGDGCVPVDE